MQFKKGDYGKKFPDVHSSSRSIINSPKKSTEKGYFAVNLAFIPDHEALITQESKSIYRPLCEPVTRKRVIILNDASVRLAHNTCVTRKALSVGLLVGLIILGYFFIQFFHVTPVITEVFRMDQLESVTTTAVPAEFNEVAPTSRKIAPRFLQVPKIPPPSAETLPYSDWVVEYDLPAGIPVVIMTSTEMNALPQVTCPYDTFALVLHLDQKATDLVGNWLRECGKNVAYYRIDGNASPEDIDELTKFFEDTKFLPRKASLNLGKGANILDNPDFIRTKNSDDVITNLELTGYITPETIEELVIAVLFAEELTITGSEVCNSLKRSLKNSDSCGTTGNISWTVLQKLSILQTQECDGLYDLINTCWSMPSLETVQIRQSMISNKNVNFINGIIDRFSIKRVDFADNVCFDDTILNYPYMCQ